MKFLLSILIQPLILGQLFSQASVLSTSDTRRIFVGRKNTVNVAVLGVECDSISLKSSQCMITGKGCIYQVEPNEFGPITFYIIKKNTQQVLDSIKVRCGSLPEPTIKLGGFHRSPSFFKDGPHVYTDYPTDLDLNLKIIDFDLRIQRGTEIIYLKKNSGSLYKWAG